MSNDQAPLTIGEFYRWADKTDKKLDGIATTQTDQGERITAVETRLEERTTAAVKKTRNTASGWAAGVAALVVAVLEILARIGAVTK